MGTINLVIIVKNFYIIYKVLLMILVTANKVKKE